MDWPRPPPPLTESKKKLIFYASPLKDILEYVFAFKRACLPFNGASVVDVVGFVAPDEVGGLIFTAAE